MFLELRDLTKAFAGEPVVDRLSLDLPEHQTLSVLGRSGCGKTTLLKLIAGLLEPDTGEIRLNGASINHVLPQRRNIVYLYQEALLFSHLDVFENVAFGLRLRNIARAEVIEKTRSMLSHLGLEAHATKRPEQLSGGQRQRVAFGRALIINPALMLLDEPFSNLDAEIRTQMQQLFKRVAHEFAITAIFVTHDLKESLIMGDRMAQMNAGQLRSFASKEEFINDPATGVNSELRFWEIAARRKCNLMVTSSPMKPADFEHYESIYWVFTQLCNDSCAHCYNNSGPKGTRISTEECLAVVNNLPPQLDRLILSGGEPLTERPKLFAILDAVRAKYAGKTQVMLQTNGDLLTGEILDELIARGVTRIDIASIDRFHKNAGKRRDELEQLFMSRGMSGDNTKPLIDKETYIASGGASFGFWGANEEMWLGGNWARGRAMHNKIWLRNPEHNFCAILSGGRGFLGGTDLPQELSIQLWRINPCCPGTATPMGDARVEKVTEVLARMSKSEIMRKINEGAPYQMGESIGLSEAFAKERGRIDGNICLWCDEFFQKHYDMQKLQPRPITSETASAA